MKITPTSKGLKAFIQAKKTQAEQESQTPQNGGKKENKLPPPGYTPIFEPTRLLARETDSYSHPDTKVKQYIELKAMRMDDNDGLPYVWMSMYQESESYTGYLKGKQVYFPLTAIYDMIDQITDLAETCEKNRIE